MAYASFELNLIEGLNDIPHDGPALILTNAECIFSRGEFRQLCRKATAISFLRRIELKISADGILSARDYLEDLGANLSCRDLEHLKLWLYTSKDLKTFRDRILLREPARYLLPTLAEVEGMVRQCAPNLATLSILIRESRGVTARASFRRHQDDGEWVQVRYLKPKKGFARLVKAVKKSIDGEVSLPLAHTSTMSAPFPSGPPPSNAEDNLDFIERCIETNVPVQVCTLSGYLRATGVHREQLSAFVKVYVDHDPRPYTRLLPLRHCCRLGKAELHYVLDQQGEQQIRRQQGHNRIHFRSLLPAPDDVERLIKSRSCKRLYEITVHMSGGEGVDHDSKTRAMRRRVFSDKWIVVRNPTSFLERNLSRARGAKLAIMNNLSEKFSHPE
ncbi:hypothetical protein BU16DRAFT_543433 [Lophium mytilinum]|uniref:Uncharacterized protein n=1 Tax=Lophium mytilinum TaxID=390894 RepID=A0A6A6QFL0_9PEZI|nr:hypothetical protein BU16DRAFT_543433 [Lophium mytilinum]